MYSSHRSEANHSTATLKQWRSSTKWLMKANFVFPLIPAITIKLCPALLNGVRYLQALPGPPSPAYHGTGEIEVRNRVLPANGTMCVNFGVQSRLLYLAGPVHSRPLRERAKSRLQTSHISNDRHSHESQRVKALSSLNLTMGAFSRGKKLWAC